MHAQILHALYDNKHAENKHELQYHSNIKLPSSEHAYTQEILGPVYFPSPLKLSVAAFLNIHSTHIISRDIFS